MAEYLYVPNNADSAFESKDGSGKWIDSTIQFQPGNSPVPSLNQRDWSVSSDSGAPSSAMLQNEKLNDPTSHLADAFLEKETDGDQSQVRKSQLSHSRSFPGLQHLQAHDQELNYRAGSASLEVPQPREFHAYSFESNLNPASSIFLPENLASHRLAPQGIDSKYGQIQARMRSCSNISLGSSAGFSSHLRSRSDSEGSNSWVGLHTPITPEELALQSSGYKTDMESYRSQGNSQAQQLGFDTSDLSSTENHPASAPIDHSLSSGLYMIGNQAVLSAISDSSDYSSFQSAQHAYASSVFPPPPVLQNIRSGCANRRAQAENSSPNGRKQSPLYWESNPCNVQLAQSASSNHGSRQSSYTRANSTESSVIARNRSSSSTPADATEDLGRWDPQTLATSVQLPNQMGNQLAGLHLEDSDLSSLSAEYGPPRTLLPRSEREALLAPFIRMYLSSTNRFLLGERTVLVLSGKVAQKSYGAEKRFLCPPPSALLLGCSWWAAAEADPRRPMAIPNRLALHPPTTIISMSGEHSIVAEAYAEWMSMSGHVVGDQASLEDVVIAGRCVGKQLHISEVDEKTKKVEALVQVIAPGFGPPEARHIGTFPSKPIKVISKPSKKRQSIKNLDLCIHHGTTIALFNRLRSQTVSTKYLCVSGPSASFPAGDWRAMSGMEEKPFAPAEDATCFVARTSAWDPFIVYLADPLKPASVSENSSAPPPLPGYPRAPSNALPLSPSGSPIPIYYNQPIVLQCLSTAVVSPVMIIRKVDKGSTATGGANLEGSGSSGGRDMPVAPGEVLGDPVSQLHKIALEVMSDPRSAYSNLGTSPFAGFPGSGSFLACLGENVGVHRAESGRQPAPPLSTPPSSASSVKSFGTSTHDALVEAAYMAAQLNQTISVNPNLRIRGVTPQAARNVEVGSSDGGKVKRIKKTSSSLSVGRSGLKGRRRAGSISSSGGIEDMGSESSDGNGHCSPMYPHASKVWTIDCGEPAVWTIVGCDVERHTFWIPPVLLDGKPSSPVSPGTVSEVFTMPIPFHPIGYETATPIPVIAKYLPPNPTSANPNDLKMITIYGANFSPHLHVWFGDTPSPNVEHKCAEVILAEPPTHAVDGQGPSSLQIILVREDGVVFPSKVRNKS
ncbi:hypothetical protein BY996DRAFT_4602068 [Phakopsora pachyrhizi]|nr:hypothetical protein BY996DRAFT_4602068 [Phakopsora pachyrhizi]